MRDLIKKILKEDLDWVSKVEPYEEGDYFLDWDGQRCWIYDIDLDKNEVTIGTYDDNEDDPSYYPYDKDDLDQYFNAGELKVIKEDFNWVDEIQPIDFDGCDWIVRVNGEKEYRELEKFLFGRDWAWSGEEVGTSLNYEAKYNHFFCDDLENKYFDSSTRGYVNKYLPNLIIHDWSTIMDAWNW